MLDVLYAASFFGPHRIQTTTIKTGLKEGELDPLEFKDFETAKEALCSQGGLIISVVTSLFLFRLCGRHLTIRTMVVVQQDACGAARSDSRKRL